MEAVSAIGLIGSVFSIADIITKSVTSLLDLQSKYKILDLKVTLLVGQLSTLKAALGHIADVMNGSLPLSGNDQFLNDLSTSLQGCETIIAALDSRLCGLQTHEDGKLTTSGKVALLWDDSIMSDYLNILNNHINALHLLLTVLQWYVRFAANIFLEY